MSAGVLTKGQFAFVAAFEGDAQEAARKVGSKAPAKMAERMMAHPLVVRALFDKQQAAIKAAGTKLGKKLTKLDILNRVIKLADLAPKETKGSINGQVNALELAAKIEGFIINKNQTLPDDFDRHSDEEKEFFAAKGYWPTEQTLSDLPYEHNTVDTGKSGTPGSKSSGPEPYKPN